MQVWAYALLCVSENCGYMWCALYPEVSNGRKWYPLHLSKRWSIVIDLSESNVGFCHRSFVKKYVKKRGTLYKVFLHVLGKSYSTTMVLYAFETHSNTIVVPINAEILSKRMQRVDRRSRVECAPLIKYPVVRVFEGTSILFAWIKEGFQHQLVDAILNICGALRNRKVWIYVVRTRPGGFK